MKKTNVLFITFLLVASLTMSVFVLAKPNMQTVPIPSHAVEVSKGVFSLGHAVDMDGKIVEGFLFLHDKKENAKPEGVGKPKKPSSSNCYAFMAKGAKWKTVENYLVDPSNNVGLDELFVEENMALNLEKWETASETNIFGSEVAGIVDGDDSVSPDNKNEVLFKNLGPTNTIAYTIVWGRFSGPPKTRELVEWDMVFNEDFPWSSEGESGKMDFENIATHEIGHALGLGHPEDTCLEETMYAYAGYGETKKRDLHAGDITGVNELY